MVHCTMAKKVSVVIRADRMCGADDHDHVGYGVTGYTVIGMTNAMHVTLESNGREVGMGDRLVCPEVSSMLGMPNVDVTIE